MRRVVFVTVVLMALVGAATGCARPGTPASPPAPSDSAPAPSDRAAIYTAMLLRFINHGAEGAGTGEIPPAVYVLDTAKSGAGAASYDTREATYPIAPADQAAITAAIRKAYRGRFEFVPSGADVVVSDNGCAHVRDGGVLVTLAPVVGTPGDRLEVGITGFVACLGATGLVYVVERKADVWMVTGTTGTMWIA